MENINIGVVNLLVSKKLNDSYFSNELNEESKKITSDFFDVIKNSPILQLEFKVFNNIEKKHINDDLSATRYIDNNIKLFEVYTNTEIDVEHKKLNKFITENILDSRIANSEKVKLYNSISNLIKESLNDYDNVDVDDIHESFTIVLNHIKSSKENLVENKEFKDINEEVIELAIGKFNDKYESLNEEDKNLLKTLIKSSDEEKQELLETYKKDSLVILENVNNENIKDKISKTIQKIREMKFNSNTINDDIISLHELKKEII